MTVKEIQTKIESCKALQGKTVEDLIETPRFRENLAAYMTEQRETRKAARASLKAMEKLNGPMKLSAHPIDRVINLTVDQFADEYKRVISRESSRSRAVRQYVEQLGRQAYNLTVAQFVIDEFPELEPILLPKTNAN